MPYQPRGPYVFQSGRRAGKTVEHFMFEDYGFLTWFLYGMNRESNGQKNVLHQHLEWVLRRGENRKTKMICPQCRVRTVKFFSVLYGYGHDDFSVDLHYTCCENGGCREILRGMALGERPVFMPFRFSQLTNFERGDRRRIAELFKEVFEIPKPLTRGAVFQFFNEDV